MRRVVVTGIGIWSSIGQNLQEVIASLQNGVSGVVSDPERLEFGLHTALVGNVQRPKLRGLLDRKYRDYLSEDSEYAFMAASEAFAGAKVDDAYLQENEVGIIWGADGGIGSMVDSLKIMWEEKDSLMVGPTALFRGETSSPSMNLSTIFHLRGINFAVGAACASSSHAIGLGKMYIQQGLQDMILVGGSCEWLKRVLRLPMRWRHSRSAITNPPRPVVPLTETEMV